MFIFFVINFNVCRLFDCCCGVSFSALAGDSPGCRHQWWMEKWNRFEAAELNEGELSCAVVLLLFLSFCIVSSWKRVVLVEQNYLKNMNAKCTIWRELRSYSNPYVFRDIDAGAFVFLRWIHKEMIFGAGGRKMYSRRSSGIKWRWAVLVLLLFLAIWSSWRILIWLSKIGK